jgi:hypothetical protein
MLEKLINQFSAFLQAFKFRPTLARFIFLLPAHIYSPCQHRNPNDNFGFIKDSKMDKRLCLWHTSKKIHIAFMGNQNGNILISNSIFSRACMRELNPK